MPRFNVQNGDMWACFSSVVDDFITPFMPVDDYLRWRKREYGKNIGDLEEANKMNLQDALEVIKGVHGKERVNEILNA